MNAIGKAETTKPALIITAVLTMILAVFIVSPTIDLLTLNIRIATTIVPLLALLFIVRKRLGRSNTRINSRRAIEVGAAIGVAAVALGEVGMRAISSLAD